VIYTVDNIVVDGEILHYIKRKSVSLLLLIS